MIDVLVYSLFIGAVGGLFAYWVHRPKKPKGCYTCGQRSGLIKFLGRQLCPACLQVVMQRAGLRATRGGMPAETVANALIQAGAPISDTQHAMAMLGALANASGGAVNRIANAPPPNSSSGRVMGQAGAYVYVYGGGGGGSGGIAQTPAGIIPKVGAAGAESVIPAPVPAETAETPETDKPRRRICLDD